MLEIIKEAGTILKDLPDLAIWILVGILFYKIVFIGGVFGIIKLAIHKIHDVLKGPREVTHKLKIGSYFFRGEKEDMELLFNRIKKDGLRYIHPGDVQAAIQLMDLGEKYLKERGK